MVSSVALWQKQNIYFNLLRMNKIIIVFCLAVAVAQAVEYARNDDYINLNRLQYKKNLDGYDSQLAFFEEHYKGRVETAVEQSKLISAAVVQNEKRFNPFILLGDYFKSCVLKYNYAFPNVLVTKKNIAICEFEASKQLSGLLSDVRDTRNEFEKYMNETYDQQLKECAEEYKHDVATYTECVTSVTTFANSYTITNQKKFASELEDAVCTAKAHIKKLLDCTFTEQTRVIGSIAETGILIKRCFDGKDECKPCEAYTCSESYDLDISSTSQTIKNPFFGRDPNQRCLMLSAKKH